MLEAISKNRDFENLNSEEIINLFEEGYLKEDIAKAFGINEKILNKIMKDKGIENIILEIMEREFITQIYYLKNAYPYHFKQLHLEYIIENFVDGISDKDFYKRKLEQLDLYSADINEIIKKKNINLDERLKKMGLDVEKTLELENGLLKKKGNLYLNLLEEKEKGRVFTKEDLTEEVLYELVVENNIIDFQLEDLFNITKNQVKYLRKKYNLQNKFLVRMVSNSDCFLYIKKMQKLIFPKMTDDEFIISYYTALYYKEPKNSFGRKYIVSYLYEHFDKELLKRFDFLNINNEEIFNIEDFNNIEFHIDIDDSIHIGHKNKKIDKSLPRKVNQIKAYKTKLDSGKLGEKIVYDYEVKKLKSWGYADLANMVTICSKTDIEDVTYDGLGYDIVSYNKNREMIYIEVKCSITNNSPNIIFDVSDKEVKFLKGKVNNINKDNCYLYYVYNIDMKSLKAKIHIIDSDTFKSFKFRAISFRVEEEFR